jgi:hypothetical protein
MLLLPLHSGRFGSRLSCDAIVDGDKKEYREGGSSSTVRRHGGRPAQEGAAATTAGTWGIVVHAGATSSFGIGPRRREADSRKSKVADAAEAEALLPLEEPSSFGLGGRTCRQGGESRGAVDEQKAVSLPARTGMTPIFAALRTRRPSAAKATLHDDVSRGALPRSFSMPRAIRFRRR